MSFFKSSRVPQVRLPELVIHDLLQIKHGGNPHHQPRAKLNSAIYHPQLPAPDDVEIKRFALYIYRRTIGRRLDFG